MTLDWVRSATPPNALPARIDTTTSNRKDGNSPQAVITSGQATNNNNNFNLNLNLNRPPSASQSTNTPAAVTPYSTTTITNTTTLSTESQTTPDNNTNPSVSTTNLPTSLGPPISQQTQPQQPHSLPIPQPDPQPHSLPLPQSDPQSHSLPLAQPDSQSQPLPISQSDPLPISLQLQPAIKSNNNASNISNISNVSSGLASNIPLANVASQAIPLPSISAHNRHQSLLSQQQPTLNLNSNGPISGTGNINITGNINTSSNINSINNIAGTGGGILAPVSSNSMQLSPTSNALPTSMPLTSMPLQGFHNTLNPSGASNPLPNSYIGSSSTIPLQPPASIHSLPQQQTPSNRQPHQPQPQPTPPQANGIYPGINSTMNSIPGLHSMSQPNMMNGLPMSFPGTGWENSFGYASMPSLHSLMPNSRLDPIGHGGVHHTSNIGIPPAASLGPSLGGTPLGSTNPFPNMGLLSGGITKPRKHRRRSELSASIKGEDATSLLMSLPPTTKYDASILLGPQTPTQNLPEADGVQFKYLHQLPEAKVRRLRDEKIKPIEELTFDDIKAYNRNQLRAYCFVYGIKRKKKAEMEKNMAKYAALFHPGDMAYDIKNFEPTKYIEGAIPRRKIPVTKEQKERAAGNTQELTKVINRRPQVSPYPGYHATASHTYPFGAGPRYPPTHRNGSEDMHVSNSEFFEDIYTIP